MIFLLIICLMPVAVGIVGIIYILISDYQISKMDRKLRKDLYNLLVFSLKD